MSVSLPSRPSLPRRPALPGGRKPMEAAAFEKLEASKPAHDQFGLALSWTTKLGERVRYWLSVAYEYLGFDKNQPPSGQGDYGSSGTIPEVAFMGALLAYGLQPNVDWFYQSEELGGRRLPGGAVLDFLVIANGLRVGVRVDSVYHASDFAFAGAAGVREDEEQRIRLLSQGSVDRVVEVNRNSDGLPLEGNNDALADNDIRRVLHVT